MSLWVSQVLFVCVHLNRLEFQYCHALLYEADSTFLIAGHGPYPICTGGWVCQVPHQQVPMEADSERAHGAGIRASIDSIVCPRHCRCMTINHFPGTAHPVLAYCSELTVSVLVLIQKCLFCCSSGSSCLYQMPSFICRGLWSFMQQMQNFSSWFTVMTSSSHAATA